MSVVKSSIPASFGRVYCVTVAGTYKQITVECFDACRAYLFRVPIGTDIREGDWITVSGTVTMELLPESERSFEGQCRVPPYLRVPYGLDSLAGWSFLEMEDPEWRKVGPDTLMHSAIRIQDIFPRIGQEASRGRISRSTIDEGIAVAREFLHSLITLRNTPDPSEIPPLKAINIDS